MTVPDTSTTAPLSATECRTLAQEMADSLVAHECNFSHPDWRYVNGLNALAERLDRTVKWVVRSPTPEPV